MDRPPENPTSTPVRPVTSRWMLPRLPVVIGVIGLGAVVTTGSWFKRQSDLRQRAEAQAIQVEVAGLKKVTGEYQARFENLQWNAAKMSAAAEQASEEPLKSWARERARLFRELVGKIGEQGDNARFRTLAEEIESLSAHGKIDEARQRLHQLTPAKFPSAAEFRVLQNQIYLKPLASFSRQNPAYYRAFQTHEPEASEPEIAALRAQLNEADLDTITPQSLLMVELLGAVAPADPLVADWTAMASAADFFENPDPATLKRWRQAKKAMRLEDWPNAVAAMQAINLSTVRTRQPFRAAYGRAILKNGADQKGEAYPFMQEAAAIGDVEARRWMAQEEISKGRYQLALPWLEALVSAGDFSAVPELLKVYATEIENVPRDVAREAGMLQRIIVAPNAPPLAWLLLARLYETGQGTPRSLEKAFECYRTAADRSLPKAWTQTARCYLYGLGTPIDFDQARDWAVRAYAAGEREETIPMLLELMKRAPDRTAGAVQELFEHEQIAAPAGFNDSRVGGTGVSQLRMQLATYLDQKGSFGAAARLYAQTGAHNADAAHRHAELTAVNPCEACGGLGKVQNSIPCATCAGKGTVLCGLCDGRGYNFIPGTPPCTTCGGSGGMMQDGHRVACSSCAGSGRGKGSVIKQTCVQCVQGRATCRDCVGGRITLTKECPACHGVGARSLASP